MQGRRIARPAPVRIAAHRDKRTADAPARAALPGRPARQLRPTDEGGQRLPEGLQSRMERAFGVDLSAVRVHEGAGAGVLDALAYTRQAEIHFGPGEYRPYTPDGQALIGHELAHVVQQRSGRVPQGMDADPRLEREAHEAGLRAARGERVHLPAAGGARTAGADTPVQRTPKWLKKILRGVGAMAPPPAAGPAPPTPLEEFVTAYENSRYYHGTYLDENARSIHAKGLLNFDDRARELEEQPRGMSGAGGGRGEFAGDEREGVYMGTRDFMTRNVGVGPIPDKVVRLFLPSDRTVVHDPFDEIPSHQLRTDPQFGHGAVIAPESVPARHAYYGNMSDLLDPGADDAAQDRLGSILGSVATHYPGPAPDQDQMAQLLQLALIQRRLSNAALQR